MTNRPPAPTCFIAMPITVHDDEVSLYRDPEHWAHVMDLLFIPAIKAAGFTPIVPTASGTSMIHGRIVRHLVEADLVLCDLSQHNPNVLFELGVRTSLDKPVALVKDEHLGLPFDIQGLNTHHYAGNLHAWTLQTQVAELTHHIKETVSTSSGANPLWQHFGIAIAASGPTSNSTPLDAKLQLLLERLEHLEHLERTSIPTEAVDRTGQSSFERKVVNMLANSPITIRSISTQLIEDGGVLALVRTGHADDYKQNKHAVILRDWVRSRSYDAEIKHVSDELIALVISKSYEPRETPDA